MSECNGILTGAESVNSPSNRVAHPFLTPSPLRPAIDCFDLGVSRTVSLIIIERLKLRMTAASAERDRMLGTSLFTNEAEPDDPSS